MDSTILQSSKEHETSLIEVMHSSTSAFSWKITSFEQLLKNSDFWDRFHLASHPCLLEPYNQFPEAFFVLTDFDKWLFNQGFMDLLPKTIEVRKLSLKSLTISELKELCEQFGLKKSGNKEKLIQSLLPSLSPDLIPSYAVLNPSYLKHLHRLAQAYLHFAVKALQQTPLSNEEKVAVIKEGVGSDIQVLNDCEIIAAVESGKTMLTEFSAIGRNSPESMARLGNYPILREMSDIGKSALAAILLGILASGSLVFMDHKFPVWLYIFIWGIIAAITFPVIQKYLKHLK